MGPDALRQLPPEQLLSRLSAAAISPLIESGTAGSQVVPSAAAVLKKVRVDSEGRDVTPVQRVEEIARQFEVALAGEGSSARDLQFELAAMLKEIDAGGTVLRAAVESNDERVRGNLINAIQMISSSFTEMSFLIGDVSRAASEIQKSIDQQAGDVRKIIESQSQQADDVRIIREELARIAERTSAPDDGWHFPGRCP